jgi:hypothetical protein
MPYLTGFRHYWQVYFTYRGTKYHLNKNNAQVNVWREDANRGTEITLLKGEQNEIRVNFTLPSGNAYFHASPI